MTESVADVAGLESSGIPILAVTGSSGFLGWHLRCAYLARFGRDLIAVSRETLTKPVGLGAQLKDADYVAHFAFDFSHEHDIDKTEETNLEITKNLLSALQNNTRLKEIIFASSVHTLTSSPYGALKRKLEALIRDWATPRQIAVSTLMLPHLVGEHGIPFSRSFFATFSWNTVMGKDSTIVDEREIEILDVQTLVDAIISFCDKSKPTIELSPLPIIRIGEVLDVMQSCFGKYRDGLIPDLSDPLNQVILRSLISHLSASEEGLRAESNIYADHRGTLSEIASTEGGSSKSFFSTTYPGRSRGHHFHRRKFERFRVVEGVAQISMRKLFSRSVKEFLVTGDDSYAIDIPTLWQHSIKPIGKKPVLTVFTAIDPKAGTEEDTFWTADI